jgi:CubicO group peptidase (beta-lactamase class C family)
MGRATQGLTMNFQINGKRPTTLVLIRRIVAALVVCACVTAVPVRSPATEAPTVFFSPAFDAYVAQEMKDWDVPGVSISIVKDGKTYAKGYGVRAVGRPEPVDDKTLFAIGSSSKAFTVAALGMLVDEKKLAWDDHVTDRLSSFRMYDPYVTREITIRDLLTHRAGLTRGDALWYGSELSRDEIVRRIRYIKPSYSFRSKFEYNNLMFLTAGQIIPAVTGESWDAFVRERLLVPLGMVSTSTTISALANQPDVAQPHESIDGGKAQVIHYRRIDNIAPAGAINSNAVDMAHWMQLLLDGGTYGGHRLLQPATLAEMFTPQTIMPLQFPWTLYAPASHFLDYGLGWILFDYRGHKAIQHAGNIDGMSALVSLLPDQHLGVTILTNKGDDFLPNAVMYRVFDDVLGGAQDDQGAVILKTFRAVFEPMLAAQKNAEAKRVLGTHPSLPLARYAGTYRNELYGDATVTRDGEGLYYHLLGTSGKLEHWNYDTFRVLVDPTAGKPTITFALDATGEAATLTVGSDPTMVFTRIPEKR